MQVTNWQSSELQQVRQRQVALTQQMGALEERIESQSDDYQRALERATSKRELLRALPKIGMGCTMVGVTMPNLGLLLMGYNRLLGTAVLGLGLLGLGGVAYSILTIESMKANDTCDKLDRAAYREKSALSHLELEHSELWRQKAELERKAQALEQEQQKLVEMVDSLNRETTGLTEHESYIEIGSQALDKA